MLLALLAVAASVSPDVAHLLLGGALSDGVAYARLEELTDTIGPRLSGSAGAEAAVRWALQKFQHDGLNARLEPVKVPHWVRGEERGEILPQPGIVGHALALTALGGSVGGEVTAEVVEARSLQEIAALGEKARGKVIFLNHTMATEDAAQIHRLLQRGPVRVHFTLGCRMLPDADSANVVADVRGREKPDEIVLLGAHLDSWDLADGANDDGAGVAMVMEAGRLLAQLKPAPRRTVRIVLYMNEENGSAGGKGYAKAHGSELGKHVAALEADSGAARPTGIKVHAGAGAAALLEPWLAPLASLALEASEGEAGGADIGPLALAGVPFVGLSVDGTHYFDIHHSAADTFDKIDPEALAKDAAAYAVTAYALAEMPQTLPRPAPEAPHRHSPDSPKAK